MENKKELIVKDRHGVEHNLYDLPKNFVFDGDIDLSGSNLRELPDLSTVTVTGSFDCWDCSNLTSLKGAPKIVNGYFRCHHCDNLETLLHIPIYKDIVADEKLMICYLLDPFVRSATSEDITSSPKYKQELANEEALLKTKSKLQARHQDENTSSNGQVATNVTLDILKAKESRNI